MIQACLILFSRLTHDLLFVTDVSLYLVTSVCYCRVFVGQSVL